MDAVTLKKRAMARKADRSNIDGVWNLIERFIVPFRAMIFQEKNSEGNVDWRRREIYDPTAIKANTNLAAHIHGALTPSVLKWFGFMFQHVALREIYEAKQWLEEADNITYMSLQESNFDLEANEVYIDLTSFGSGALSSIPKEDSAGGLDKTQYKAMPMDECYFDFDVDGNVMNFYRILQWTVDQIIDKFGFDNVPHVVRAAHQNADQGDRRFKILFTVYKRPENADADTFTQLAPENRPFGSKYIFWDDSSELGEESGFHEMPVFAPLWRRTSGSKHGFSPSMIAIWDVLTLNQMEELVLVAGEKVLDPTIMTTKKGVYGDIDLSAGGTVVVQDIEKSMAAFESKARFDVSALQKQDLIRSIRDTYYVDELQLKESPAMTAAEVHARIQLMQRLLGPTFGRLQTHFLDPVVTRQFMINFRYGIFPPMPPALVEAIEGGQGRLKIEYLAALAKSQKMDAAASLDRWMGSTSAISDIYPNVRDIPNVDEVVREQAENEGIPTRLINSRVEVMKRRRIRSQQEAQIEQTQLASMQGEAAKQMGEGMKAVKEGASDVA